MKQSLFVILMLLVVPFRGLAQKFAYIDSEYILGQMPEYKSAQKQLDDLALTWQKELEQRMAQIEKLYKEYQEEKMLLTSDLREKREQQIADAEADMKKYQQQKFGPEGDLFKKRQELVKPIQDKVFDAVQKVAKKNALDFIFDKAGDMIFMYSNAKFDRSDEVLEEMGINPTQTNKKEEPKDKKQGPTNNPNNPNNKNGTNNPNSPNGNPNNSNNPNNPNGNNPNGNNPQGPPGGNPPNGNNPPNGSNPPVPPGPR